MKILKGIIIALIVILVIAAVGIYFLPNHFVITNSIEINKPVDVVRAQVTDFNKWLAWGPWIKMEPDANYSFEGAPGTVGHKMYWDGKKVGVGNITLDFADNTSMKANLQFMKPYESTGRDKWTFEDLGGKTKATWQSTGGLKYPMGRVFGLMVDKMVGDMERQGLENLKNLCESLPDPPPPAPEMPVDTMASSSL